MNLDIDADKRDENKLTRYNRYLGENYNPKDYLALDVHPLSGRSLVKVIKDGLYFKNNTIGTIICIHCLKHFQVLSFIIKEFHRVLKPGGCLRFWLHIALVQFLSAIVHTFDSSLSRLYPNSKKIIKVLIITIFILYLWFPNTNIPWLLSGETSGEYN